ncbi:DUF481 domain-containing protein [Flammeovirga agarivorans]|uniref:DUF481 domain-containing protein n=1 Tax=Flammeovirga agarivorans TaxID=2726742 RepID=A0A7X8SIB6_9BACT|nr:DUF481 domain-containing protein [Flammeovirga agarivorans]NLR90745.1 DUF481 domain-containing protein [Flammeovirga agarivorans]
MKRLALLLLFTLPLFSNAQDLDSLVMTNGDLIVGEIKSMDRGVVEIETDYSDSNFKIEWSGIQKMFCHTNFLISLSDGRRYNGHITSTTPETFHIISDEDGTVDVTPNDIVYLKSVNQSFLSKLSANIDLGYSYTKANNLSQLNLGTFLGYTSNRWSATLTGTSLRSTQDNSDDIARNEGNLTGNYFLPHDFYFTASAGYLTNTEQSINLRLIFSGGFGKYIIHTNTAYWGFSTGASYLNETFSPVTDETTGQSTTADPRSSAEWYLGTEVNLFDTGDLSFFTGAKGYRSLSNEDRWRADVNANIKYDLPLDFYIKMGYNMNYDSKPAEAGKEVDFQYTFGFGWEL